MHDFAPASAYLEECLDVFKVLNDRWGVANTLSNLSFMAISQGDLTRAETFADDALQAYRQLGDKHGITNAALNRGAVASRSGDHGRAVILFEESLAASREIGDKRGTAQSLLNLAKESTRGSDFSRVEVLCEESLSLFRDLADTHGVETALLVLARAAIEQGQIQDAIITAQEGLSLAQAIEDREDVASYLTILGRVKVLQGDIPRAQTFLDDALSTAVETGNCWTLSECLDGIVELLARSHALEQAAWVCGAADAQRAAHGETLTPVARPIHDMCVDTIAAHLGETVFDAVGLSGRTATLDGVIAYARSALCASEQGSRLRTATPSRSSTTRAERAGTLRSFVVSTVSTAAPAEIRLGLAYQRGDGLSTFGIDSKASNPGTSSRRSTHLAPLLRGVYAWSIKLSGVAACACVSESLPLPH